MYSHDAIVAAYVQARRMATSGFREELNSLLVDVFGDNGYPRLGLRPDAFRVSDVGSVVEVLEVEITSRLDWRKLGIYADIDSRLRLYGWRLDLFVVNQYLHPPTAMDLTQYRLPASD